MHNTNSSTKDLPSSESPQIEAANVLLDAMSRDPALAGFRTKFKSLLSCLSENQATEKTLSDMISVLGSEVTKKVAETNALVAARKERDTQLVSLKRELAIENGAGENDPQAKSVEDVERELREVKADCEAETHNSQTLSSEFAITRSRHALRMEEVVDLQRRLCKSLDECKPVSAEIASLKEKLAETRQSVSKFSDVLIPELKKVAAEQSSKKDAVEKELNGLIEETGRLRKTSEMLQQQLTEKSEERSDSIAHCTTVKKQADVLMNENAQTKEFVVPKLERAAIDLKHKTTRVNETTATTLRELEDVVRNNRNKERDIVSVDRVLADRKGIVGQLSDRERVLKEAKATCEARNAETLKSLEDLEGQFRKEFAKQLTEQESEMASLLSSVRKTQAAVATTMSNVAAESHLRDDQASQVRAALRVVGDLNRKASESKAAINRLTDDISRVTAKIVKTQASTETQTKATADLESSVKASFIDPVRDSLKPRLDRLKALHKDLVETVRKESAALLKEQKSAEELDNHRNDLVFRSSQLRKSLQSKAVSLAEVIAEKEGAECSSKLTEERVRSAKIKSESLAAGKRIRAETVSALTKNVNVQSAELATLSRCLESTSQERDLLKMRLTALQRNLAEKIAAHSKDRADFDATSNKARKVHRELEAIRRELKEFHAEVTSEQSLLNQTQTSVKLDSSRVEKLLCDIKVRNSVMTEELENQLNVHAWRQLETTNPALMETIHLVTATQREIVLKSRSVDQLSRKLDELTATVAKLKKVKDLKPIAKETKLVREPEIRDTQSPISPRSVGSDATFVSATTLISARSITPRGSLVSSASNTKSSSLSASLGDQLAAVNSEIDVTETINQQLRQLVAQAASQCTALRSIKHAT